MDSIHPPPRAITNWDLIPDVAEFETFPDPCVCSSLACRPAVLHSYDPYIGCACRSRRFDAARQEGRRFPLVPPRRAAT